MKSEAMYGFISRGEYLDHVMFRMGVLAVLRSKEEKVGTL